MDRFVSKRPSSSVDLDASSLDNVRTERAAIALSVGLSWPPVKRRRSVGRPSWQQLWERARQDHTLKHHELPHGVRLQRLAWWRPGEATDRPLTHEELAHTKTPRAAPATPAAALVEDEPSGSGSKRRKVHVDPMVCDCFLDMLDQWRTMGEQRSLCEVRRLCPGMFDGIKPNTPYRGKRSAPRAAPLGRRCLLSPADMTRLSEHIMRVTDVLCLSAVTVKGLVHEWLDSEELKELHSPALQEANTHRLFIKLCWLMDKHAVSADRVVNIDETSCRLLPVHQIGWGRRGVKQAQIQGSTREATTFTVAFSMDRGPLDMLVQIVHAGKTDAVLPEKPWPERTHHVTSENGWATTTTLLQHAVTLDDVMNPSKEGQAWILLWDTASIHASEATLAAMRAAFPHVVLCFIPPRSTSYLQPCDVAVFRSFKSCIQTQASATLARSVLDGGASLRPNRHLVQPRSCATRTRRGQLDGIACAQAATPSSARPWQRPRHSAPTMSSSPSTSSQLGALHLRLVYGAGPR